MGVLEAFVDVPILHLWSEISYTGIRQIWNHCSEKIMRFVIPSMSVKSWYLAATLKSGCHLEDLPRYIVCEAIERIHKNKACESVVSISDFGLAYCRSWCERCGDRRVLSIALCDRAKCSWPSAIGRIKIAPLATRFFPTESWDGSWIFRVGATEQHTRNDEGEP